MKRSDWLAALRHYLGTPFLHQGRSDKGIDCVGLLSCAAADIGLHATAKSEINGYSHVPNDKLFKLRAPNYLSEIPCNRLQPLRKQLREGDVIIFWIDRKGFPRHVAVYTGVDANGNDTMIHSFAKAPRSVVEGPIHSGYWTQRIDSLWAVPGLED